MSSASSPFTARFQVAETLGLRHSRVRVITVPVLLKAFALEGRLSRQRHDIPGAVIVHVASQVNVPADLYPRYE